MELLKQRILRDGKSLSKEVLRVDNFINHQLDPQLLMAIGVEFARRFSYGRVNKILTIEASGIAPAVMTGYCCGICQEEPAQDNGKSVGKQCSLVYQGHRLLYYSQSRLHKKRRQSVVHRRFLGIRQCRRGVVRDSGAVGGNAGGYRNIDRKGVSRRRQ